MMARTMDGAISVLLNRSAHRGTLVCAVPHGSARVFSCPYHGWTYDLGGELLGVPYPGGLDRAFDKRALGLARAAA